MHDTLDVSQNRSSNTLSTSILDRRHGGQSDVYTASHGSRKAFIGGGFAVGEVDCIGFNALENFTSSDQTTMSTPQIQHLVLIHGRIAIL